MGEPTKDRGKWKKGHTMNSSSKCKALVMPRKKYSGNYMMFGLMVFSQLWPKKNRQQKKRWMSWTSAKLKRYGLKVTTQYNEWQPMEWERTSAKQVSAMCYLQLTDFINSHSSTRKPNSPIPKWAKQYQTKQPERKRDMSPKKVYKYLEHTKRRPVAFIT